MSACREAAQRQAETQPQPILAPENAPQGESVESKSERGCRRPGAGGKPNLAKRLLAPQNQIESKPALEAEVWPRRLQQKGKILHDPEDLHFS